MANSWKCDVTMANSWKCDVTIVIHIVLVNYQSVCKMGICCMCTSGLILQVFDRSPVGQLWCDSCCYEEGILSPSARDRNRGIAMYLLLLSGASGGGVLTPFSLLCYLHFSHFCTAILVPCYHNCCPCGFSAILSALVFDCHCLKTKESVEECSLPVSELEGVTTQKGKGLWTVLLVLPGASLSSESKFFPEFYFYHAWVECTLCQECFPFHGAW